MRGVSFISESRSDSLCLCFLCVCVCGKQERRYLVIFFCCGFVLLYRCCRGGRPERLCGIFAETCKFCLHFFFSPWLCVIPVGADFCVCVGGGGGKTGCRKCRLLADVMVCVWGAGKTEFFICPSVAANTTHSCSVADCYSATWACPDTLRPTGAPLTALWGCGSTRSLTFHNKPPRRYVTHRLPTKVQEVTRGLRAAKSPAAPSSFVVQ